MTDYSYLDYVSMAVSDPPSAYHASPITRKCKTEISDRFNIPEIILNAYLKTEGASEGHIRNNSDGTWDVGPMQINSSNWNTFYKKFGVLPVDIRYNGCINLMAGAYIIREHMDKKGKENITDWNTFFQIAANYHSKTPEVNSRYQEKWVENLTSLLEVKDNER